MAEVTLLPGAHELVRRIEAEHRPGGGWIYDADPSWSADATIVFPERILLRIARTTDEDPRYSWQIERWDPADETYQPIPGQAGSVAAPLEMIEQAVAFIDAHNAGEPLPVTVYPLAYELGDRIAAGYPRAHWQHYTNDVYADVFEYPGLRRLAFWDEANFMGSIDGYTWVQEEYRPGEDRWVAVAASSDVVSLGQLRRTIADFHNTGEAPYHPPVAPSESPDVTRGAARGTEALARAEVARRLAERAAALGGDDPAPGAAPAPGREGPRR